MATQAQLARETIRVGAVSFLNAKPLLYGFEEERGIELHLDVPSRLLDGLLNGRFDVALLPVIDYQRMDGLRILTSGGIGCDGPTLTVRIFSPVPIEQITMLACDTDSHTSVALARVMLAEVYHIQPEFVPLDRASDDPNLPRLLIGDKVVCQEPRGLPYQLDLGQAWKQYSGLPFVFAAWMARPGIDLGDLPARLERAWHEGLAHVEGIIARFAVARGWPQGIARQYLCEYLKYDIGPRHLDAIRRFHALAAQYGLVPQPARGLEVISPA